MTEARVVTLLPSASEIVCIIGMESSLVGVSHECDFPSTLSQLPQLTRYRTEPARQTSASIDASIREAMLNALAVYLVDEEKLGELRPTIIVTQDLCQVCAVSMDAVEAAVARLAGRENVEIISISPTLLEHMYDDIERVATALGVPENGRKARKSLEDRMDALRSRSASAPKLRVATVEWMSPIMLGGTWMPALVEAAGGIAVGAEAGKGAPTVSWEELEALAPDVILLKPCGYPIAQSQSEPELLAEFVEKFPNARVYLTDGNAYFNRSGPRLVDSAELLAGCLHPELFADFAETYAHSVVRLS